MLLAKIHTHTPETLQNIIFSCMPSLSQMESSMNIKYSNMTLANRLTSKSAS